MQNGGGCAPVLLGDEDGAQLEMRLGIVRLEFNGDATFLHSGVQVSNAGQRSGQSEPAARVFGSHPDGAARFPERHCRIGLLES